uniref:Uncharacterized protein n=1 Tax=Rhizophora mucronata TaxID=61149 RepID=A0A2P2P5A2_RHIMU
MCIVHQRMFYSFPNNLIK